VSELRPAVFLDRDDTLIPCRELPPAPAPANPGDLVDPSLVRLLPGVAESLGDLRKAGFQLVIVSNQGLVARGAGTLETVAAVNSVMLHLIEVAAPTDAPRPIISRIYVCPFHPNGTVPAFTREHPARKPAPGMLLEAAKDLALNLPQSWLIGDAERDIQAGINAGLRPDRCLRIGPDAPHADLAAATSHLLARHRGAQRCVVTLRAVSGEPLTDRSTRDTVVASARALAERTGIVLDDLRTTRDSIEVSILADRLTGIGFAAELRRSTNAWYEAKYHDGPLWGSPRPGWEFDPDA